jgi:hypothetical protein
MRIKRFMIVLGIMLVSCVATANTTTEEASNLAEKAYIFGYPLVLMDTTRQIMTNVPTASAQAAPINQFAHVPVLPDIRAKNILRPQLDTLASSAWVNVSKEPMILHLPNTQGRYYFVSMLDGWTNVFASLGKRTTGTQGGDFAIVGPKWRGSLPANIKEIKAPTSNVWLLARIQTNNANDVAAVNALQQQMKLTPLHMWGKNYEPAMEVAINPQINMKVPPGQQIAQMDAKTFLNQLAFLLKTNPPAVADSDFIKDLAKIGVKPGQNFAASTLDSNIIAAIEEGMNRGIAQIKNTPPTGKEVNGWLVFVNNIGSYGTDYLQRARIAYFGLGANLAEDAVYPASRTDASGQLFSGKKNYVLHFSKEELAASNAFWTITSYNDKQLFTKNSLQQYSLGSRDPLVFNNDGSLDIYIQHTNPGQEKVANWLPVPKGTFDLIMRIYWPKSEVLQGKWSPPTVREIVT